MAQIFGEMEADRALRDSHVHTFEDWLCFGLERQKADLDLYLSSFEPDKRTILETWIRLTPYRNLVPSTVRDVERRLYLSDLEALLDLLKKEYSVVSPDLDCIATPENLPYHINFVPDTGRYFGLPHRRRIGLHDHLVPVEYCTPAEISPANAPENRWGLSNSVATSRSGFSAATHR